MRYTKTKPKLSQVRFTNESSDRLSANPNTTTLAFGELYETNSTNKIQQPNAFEARWQLHADSNDSCDSTTQAPSIKQAWLQSPKHTKDVQSFYSYNAYTQNNIFAYTTLLRENATTRIRENLRKHSTHRVCGELLLTILLFI